MLSTKHNLFKEIIEHNSKTKNHMITIDMKYNQPNNSNSKTHDSPREESNIRLN